jgi:hypothetical protein
VKALEEELRLAANHADDVANLKNRILQLSERIRQEKEYKRNFELEGLTLKKKVDMLSDHIEKLVMHIKREGAQKLKFAESMKLLEKENGRLKEKYDLIHKKVSAKDRLIYELREGSKVLEDQLKLMDEKYLELRNKLDYARYMANKKIKKAEKIAADLRVKFAMTGSSVPLDSLQLPSSSDFGDGAFSVGGQSASTAGRLIKGNSSSGLLKNGDMGSMYDDQSLKGSKNGKLQLMSVELSSVPDGVPTMTTQTTMRSQTSLMSLDSVLEKIRLQQGNKTDWTEDKVRKMVNYNKPL